MRELPDGDGWQYEPKWDGFRGVLENLGGGLRLWSRNERPLLRYFPELAELGERLPAESALDGEVVIERGGALDFEALQMRLHPAESRSRGSRPRSRPRSSSSTCSSGTARSCTSSRSRSGATRVEKLPFAVSPATRDRGGRRALGGRARPGRLRRRGREAARLALPAGLARGGREGQEATGPRTASSSASPGREGERLRDRSCSASTTRTGSCGRSAPRPRRGPKRDEIAALVQPLLGPNPERRPRGEPSRWQKEQLEWSPIEPKLVVEVRYDKWQGQRFRHGTKLPPLPPGQGSGRSAPSPRSPTSRARAT